MAVEVTLYPSGDGFVAHTSSTSWATVRDATAGDYYGGGYTATGAVRATFTAGRPAPTYSVSRTSIVFDTSEIPTKPRSGVLSVQGITNDTADIRVVRGTGTPYAAGFPMVHGWVNGENNTDNVTFYDSGSITTWNLYPTYNDITLSEAALNGIASGPWFSTTFMEARNDLRNIAPNALTTGASGIIFSELAGTSSDPKLVLQLQDNIFMGCNF